MPETRFALVDLGSNSIRMVVFDRDRPFAAPLLNEKAVVELGKGLETTGEIAPDRLAHALRAFAHFKWLLNGLGIEEITIVATAATRDAKNAQDLIAPVEELMQAKIQVLPEASEARFAALGVLLTCPGAEGLVADLGGGSLQFSEIGPQGVGRCVSMPLGVLRLESKGLEGARAALKAAFAEVPWLKDLKRRHRIYLVGGTWRALARAHMARKAYPLDVIHRYAAKSKTLKSYAQKLVERPEERLDAMDHVPTSRRRKLPWAALALQELIEVTACKRVVFSGAGLREGASAELMGRDAELTLPQSQRYDRAIAALIPDGGRFGNPGQNLFDWMSPLFVGEKDALRDRRRQACQLFDFGWEAHPSYRKTDIPSAVLHSATLTQSHKDRAYLALVLLLRHGGHLKEGKDDTWLELVNLLPKGHQRHAIATGYALRLAHRISRGIIPLIQSTSLSIEDLRLTLKINREDLAAMSHLYSPALSRLSSALALEPKIRKA